MATPEANDPNPVGARSTRTDTTFSLTYSVATRIEAPTGRVWEILTDVESWPDWNSTVSTVQGRAELGRRIRLTVPIAPDRTFRPRVVGLEPPRRMVWQDGVAPLFRGTRTYLLAPEGEATTFEMTEAFRGVVLPLIRRSLPDMREPFDTFAADLKARAEQPGPAGR